MNRKWTEKEKEYFSKYDAEHTMQIKLKLNKKNDRDIIDQLNKVENKQGYIKCLIREDIKKGE